MYVRWEGVGARLSSSLFAVVSADGDDGVGDERAVTAVLVEQFQTTHYHLHGGAAVGERVNHYIDIHLFRARRSDEHVAMLHVGSGRGWLIVVVGGVFHTGFLCSSILGVLCVPD